ncbi:extracellular solute-binding protein [Clostridium sp. WB02_MRS01]|uniref:ABC transporter substrate-binding protein n=1 Tax=Clostridium sp. WB02_MRS01 TaxID=2605777 RepID=UPI0012B18DB9|nr:extracellular solute-binding protein [Clostridium sp. WB02_MRS01]MSS08506.1 extracellular solute-binding protein [Clostridium sp. WB02_MRS01]
MKGRITSVLLAGVMAVSLTACGGSGSTGQKTAEKTGGQGKMANELTVWCWDPAFNIYAMEEAAKIYQKDHPDFKLNVVETPTDTITTKLATAVTSKNLDALPDIMLIQDGTFQKNVISFPEAFMDLTDSGIDFSMFAQGKTAYSVVEGKHYGVPFDNGAAIAAYRTDVLEEAGYTIDDFTDITWRQYQALGDDILAKTGKPLLSCTSGDGDVLRIMLQSTGGSLFDKEGNPSMVGNDKLKKAMEAYASLVKNGVLVEVNKWDQYVGTITTGTVAGVMNGCWIMGSIQTAEDQSGKWAITNVPKLEGVDGATNYANQGGSSWAVAASSKNPELATDFLAKTFGGSTELYETILPKSGALAAYLPAADSKVYSEPQAFFGGKPVYAQITEFASKVPSYNPGVYYAEANQALMTAMTNVLAGADIDAEIKTAEDTVKFAMGK